MSLPVSLGLWSDFVTLFVTISPIETGAVFAAVTGGIHKASRKKSRKPICRDRGSDASIIRLMRAAGTWNCPHLVSRFPGRWRDSSVPASSDADLCERGLSSISEGEQREAEQPGDIAVLPLAFPTIAGPGSLSAIVLIMSRSTGHAEQIGILRRSLSVCCSLSSRCSSPSILAGGLAKPAPM